MPAVSGWHLGLRGRALLAMALVLGLVAGLVALLVSRQDEVQTEVRQLGLDVLTELHAQVARDGGQRMAAEMARRLSLPLSQGQHERAGRLLDAALRQPVVAYVQLLDDHGDLVLEGRDGNPQLVLPGTEGVIDVLWPVLHDSRSLGQVSMGITLAQWPHPGDHVGQRLEQGLAAISQRYFSLGIALLVVLALLAMAAAVYIQRTLVGPIQHLVAAARRIENGDYSIQLDEVRASGEVGELLRVFSRMSLAIARHDRQVRQLAYTDALTGLANRLAFRQQLESRVGPEAGQDRAAEQMALLFVDVDDFKRVNDTLGHEAGDEFLLGFAGRIRQAVAQVGGEGALLARFGGDEFVILIDGEGAVARASALAHTLVDELAKPLSLDGREIFLGSSIGITLYPDDATDASGLIKNGDIAMYQAKAAGKNCFRYYSRAMDHAVGHRLQLENDLRGAWARGELHLVFQPIYRLRDRRLVGAETLLRWQHPTLGTIPPSVFIPIAESSGLIEQLGPMVLREACRQARRWIDHPGGEQMFVAVNVSPRQLRNGDLTLAVANSLAESGLAPSRLHIELTETAVMGDEKLATTLLDTLHRHGVKVWLDDFGTGFSGLSHLRQVPVDGVKIDKSFIADLHLDQDDLALTTAIIAMCHALGITVVAEGIEQEVQFNLLAHRGCDLVQGYWLSRPLTSVQLMEQLQAQA